MRNKKHKNNLYLISNMYPSRKNVRYGIFVKNFEKAVADEWNIKKIVLVKIYNKFWLLLNYIKLYYKIFLVLFKAKENDIIYVHFPLYMSPVLSLFCFKKSNVILNFHGADLIFKNMLRKFLSFFQKCLVTKFHCVVPSPYYKQKLIKMYNISPEKVYVYPSGGINPQIFYPDKKKISDEKFTISYVSSFIKEKGWVYFLEAIKKLSIKKDIKNLNVIMVGDGPDKNSIMEYIKQNDLQIEIYTGLTHPQISEVYRKSDIFIFPTILPGESLGLVGLEAMACGTPVIGSDKDALKTYLKNEKNGFLFEQKNADDLYQKIIRYYNLPKNDKKAMSEEAIKTSTEYYNHKVNKELLNFLKSIINHNHFDKRN